MVELIRSISDFNAKRATLGLLPADGGQATIGVVPTMGNLHAGHGSLVQQSLIDNDATIVTIFVNPKQFGPNEDFSRYPRTLEKDLDLLNRIKKPFGSKPLLVFAPENVDDIFPKGFQTSILINELSKPLCGRFRPGHFDGVATVVYRLLNITRPTLAYFGSKDFQQLAIIKRMVIDLNMPVQIIPMPIIREADGLALSSRNQYLKGDERKLALKLPESLNAAATIFSSQNFDQAQAQFKNYISTLFTDSQVSWEYLEFLDAQNLTTPEASAKEWLIAGAMKVGATRLIDNLVVQNPQYLKK